MKLLLALIPLFFLFGCNKPTYTFNYDLNEDFSKLKTYRWKDSQNKNDALLDHWLFRKKVMIVADKILAEKGFILVTDSTTQADFDCVLLGVLESDTSIVVSGGSGASVGYGVGYGDYGYGGYGSAFASSYGSTTYNSSGGFDENGGYGGYGHYGGARPTSVAVGVSSGGEPRTSLEIDQDAQLVFDIVNTQEKRLVWRTTVTLMDMSQDVSAQKSDEFVQNMVATILANFPPPVKK